MILLEPIWSKHLDRDKTNRCRWLAQIFVAVIAVVAAAAVLLVMLLRMLLLLLVLLLLLLQSCQRKHQPPHELSSHTRRNFLAKLSASP